jgi:hypothetical protein
MDTLDFTIKAVEQKVRNLSKRAAKGDRAAERVLGQQLARLANLREGEVVYD